MSRRNSTEKVDGCAKSISRNSSKKLKPRDEVREKVEAFSVDARAAAASKNMSGEKTPIYLALYQYGSNSRTSRIMIIFFVILTGMFYWRVGPAAFKSVSLIMLIRFFKVNIRTGFGTGCSDR